ncbi:AAA family ATPase [Brevibacillus sp. 179-C9.3 HS]|uniref:AAA family ATPase n=1 Tax=unclassified Brevibacillus TaxID=2684853 RepID=UPI0039A33053
MNSRESNDSQWNYYEEMLRWLDTHLLRLLAVRAQQGDDYPLDQMRGVIVTEEEVVRLLEAAPQATQLWDAFEERVTACEERLHALHMRDERSVPLLAVADAFSLNRFELGCLFLCLAVELDRKYEKLFGYLLDDITCKSPTPELAMQLFCRTAGERIEAWTAFTLKSKLGRLLLFTEADLSGSGSWLSRPLKLDERMLHFLTTQDGGDDSLPPWLSWSLPGQELEPLAGESGIRLQERFEMVWETAGSDSERLLLHLHGPTGVGKRHLLRHLFHGVERPILLVDVERLIREEAFARKLQQVMREVKLRRGVLCLHQFEACLTEEIQTVGRKQLLIDELESFSGCVAIVATSQWKPGNVLSKRIWLEMEVPSPDDTERRRLWETGSAGLGLSEEIDLGILAGKFRLNAGQIKQALHRANEMAMQTKEKIVSLDQLHEACFVQMRHSLEKHAVRLTPKYSWQDLVLPDEQLVLLRNACNQVTYRNVVLGEWGFGRRLSYGKGVSMLFAGPPGTGKTMSAEVVANELGLEIYKIDLSQVISKYIGETEKNLHQIFSEARIGNAILFFDEADALFGKRSEVKDSHDKYANVETAYLLQKMEEYEGVSILATNLLQNFDEAFMRRINYVVKFPFPDPSYREEIWRSMFPIDTPRAADIDFEFLASKLHIAGGGIKNVVLAACFLAASEGKPVSMSHLIMAAKQELKKTGKLLLKEDLGEYAKL